MTARMRRREFVTLVGGAAAAWPLAAYAQQARRNRKLGVLHPGQATVVNSRITAIREGLNDPGHQGDSGIELVIRLADGHLSRLPALVARRRGNRMTPRVHHAAGGAAKVWIRR
jgi:putative ABC transport system substrate-binding protein